MVNADSMQLYRGMDIGTAKVPARRTPRDAASSARRADVSADGDRRGLPTRRPGGRSRTIRARGPHAAAGRRFRPVHPGRDRRDRFPGNRSRGPGAAARRNWAGSGIDCMFDLLAELDPAAAVRDRPGQRPQDRPRAGGDRADRPAVHRDHAPAAAARVRRGAAPARPADRSLDLRLDERVRRWWMLGFLDEVRRLEMPRDCDAGHRHPGRWGTPSCWPCWTAPPTWRRPS